MSDSPLILYIEDNSDNRRLVSRVLKAAGFNCHGVGDAMTGLKFIQEQTPALIIVDINLPVIDGYTLTRQLRQLEKLAHTPILALTANVMKEDRDKSIEAGCDGFIRKPIDVDRLPEQIWSYLTRN